MASCCGQSRSDQQAREVTPYQVNDKGPAGFLTQQPLGTPSPDIYAQHKSISPPPPSFSPPLTTSPIQAYGRQSTLMQPGPQSWGTATSPVPTSSSPPLMEQQQRGFSGSNLNGATYTPPQSPGPGGSFLGQRAGSVYQASLLDNRLSLPPSAITATHRRDFGGPPPLPVTADGTLSVSIDFGTTFSGVAYGSSRIAGGAVQQILHWPGTTETFRKVPTCLLYDEDGRVLAWGLEAKNSGPIPGTTRCEWFKLFLEPNALRDHSAADPRLPPPPPGKVAIDLIVDYLSCLWEYAKDQITKQIGSVADLDSAIVWLTVPAAWDAKGCEMMREAAIEAQLVHSSRPGDTEWRERLKIITEPEAAAVHCAHMTDLHKLRPSQNFMIGNVVDAGGGTVDLAVYRILGEMHNLEIAEMCARSGGNCGSIFLDLRFRELVQTLLREHPAHLDAASLENFMYSFREADKLTYRGVADDDTTFYFTCFSTEDLDDPSVGLINGELAIPGHVLRREVFDPVVEQVLRLIEEQSKKLDRSSDALLLVGGFSQSEYLLKRVQDQFSNQIRVIARPADADTATLRGAARYGLSRRPLVSSVIVPRSYIMKVKLPAEQVDWQLRPAYITTNNAGVSVCENRLQYLVQKGAILRKGQRITTKFCKFSASPQDSHFVAVMYTSDSDRTLRYTDEGQITELCKWQVDLTSLPSFQQNANMPSQDGFYTEFELGLELDSAEVRGILLWQGQEWGRVVFDFLN